MDRDLPSGGRRFDGRLFAQEQSLPARPAIQRVDALGQRALCIRGNDLRDCFDLTVIVGMKIDVIRAWRQHAIDQGIEPLFHLPDELEDDGPPRRPLPSLHTGSMVCAVL